ncbi:MAG: CPBP family intramembrane metalloprotease [Lentisphaerae bacterium]|nr:CPBP family intramembrane metalloprotease [Lentisphaerota bacterium]
MSNPSKPVISLRQALILAVLFLGGATWLASASAVLIMQGASSFGGPLGAYLMEAGGGKVMRRCLLVFSLVFLLLFLRRAGWRGWKDCGFTTTDPDWSWRAWHVGLRHGLILGILSMSAVGTLTILAGIHHPHVTLSAAELLKKVVLLLIAGLAVGFFEETVMRGIFFRVFARVWRAWPAAVLSSVVFAAAHFGEPSSTAFSGNSFLSITHSVFVSTFTSLWQIPRLTVQFINLTLLGIVLCAFVIRTKTIWFSVGAHAAWVWMIKLHELFTIFYPAAPLAAWLGKRNDFMDSPLATIILSGVLAWIMARAANSGQLLRRHGQTWHVLPSQGTRFSEWLACPPAQARPGSPARDVLQSAPLPDVRVLKAYAGCRVTACGGMVWKEYYPVAGWRGWRWRFLSSRTRRAFLMGRELTEHGIPTPTPIAWGCRRRCGLRLSDHGITAELKQAEGLTAWLERQARDPARRAEVMRAYGQLAGRFHRAGFSNRDLKHENVLCAQAEPEQLWVVDLDGVRRRLWISRRRAGRDLRRVGLSLRALGWCTPPDVGEFFAAYNASVSERLRREGFPG